MIYETGSATTPNDLLSKLNDFLFANNWNIEEFSQVDENDPAVGFRLVVSNSNGKFFGFRSFIGSDPTREDGFVSYQSFNEDVNGIATLAFDSFDPNRELDQQVGAISQFPFMQLTPDFCEKYNFFSDVNNDFIGVVAEYTSGFFSAISHAKTDLGFQCFTGTSNTNRKNINDKTALMFSWDTNNTNFIRQEGGSFSTDVSKSRTSTGNAYGSINLPTFSGGSSISENSIINVTASADFDGNFFVHCYQYLEDERRTPNNDFSIRDNFVYRFAGTVDNFLFCSTRKLNPNEEISLGGDVYKFFPTYTKSEPFEKDTERGNQGFLIRKG